MKLKVCGNTNQENINEFMEIAPDYLGFIFYPNSKRYVGNDKSFVQYISSLTASQKVGVFVNAPFDIVGTLVKDYQLDMVQLHGNESVEYCRQIAQIIPVIKAFGVQSGFDFESIQYYTDSCKYFLFDTVTPDYGGSGKMFDWSLLDSYKSSTPFFLSGGIGMEHIPALKSFKHNSFVGIDVNSRFELSPGIKNINYLKKFVYELQN